MGCSIFQKAQNRFDRLEGRRVTRVSDGVTYPLPQEPTASRGGSFTVTNTTEMPHV